MPRAYKSLGLDVTDRVLEVIIEQFGTKSGLLDFEGFILSLAKYIKHFNKWDKHKERAKGQFTMHTLHSWWKLYEIDAFISNTKTAFP